MRVHHSYAEHVLGTLTALLKDCADMYPAATKEFERDEKRLSSAIKDHGVEFALVTMPSFRKHFDKCLSEARLTPSGLTHFGPAWRGSPIPRLFRGLMIRVFDRFGTVRTDCDPHAVRAIRQLLGAVRKLRMECDIKDTRESVREFVTIDAELPPASSFWGDSDDTEDISTGGVAFLDATSTGSIFLARMVSGAPHHPYGESDPRLLDMMQRVADIMATELGSFDPSEWRLRHGPGAVADSRFGAYKYAFDRWPARLEESFPSSDFAFANYDYWVDSLRSRGPLDSSEVPSRLAAVPKTLKTPRLIAVEATSMQWCQQGIRDFLYSRIKETCYSQGIDFRDQTKNATLALKASMDQSHATIDLSSASDRVSCWHVERLFRRSPALLQALRSTRAVYLRQDICRFSPSLLRLRKFSTMGNAVTFPVQSIFFMTVAVARGLLSAGSRPSSASIRKLLGRQVRVFGDDIIVPVDFAGELVRDLHTLGLRVNHAKTFEAGRFKESCGMDAYDGHDVTTVNIMEFPRRSGPGSTVSTVDAHNNLLDRGWFRAAQYLRKTAERLGYRSIRTVARGSGSFGWHENMMYPAPLTTKSRWNSNTHTREYLCTMAQAKSTRVPASEGYGLLQFFTEAPKQVTSAVSTLGYLARRPQVSLSLRWA